MKISGIRFGLALLFVCELASFAGVAPQIISQPNSYSFNPADYYADADATNVSLTVVLHPGNPSMQGGVAYYSEDGTAVAGRDYDAVSGLVTLSIIPAFINVPLHPSMSPTNKTFRLVLYNIGTPPSDRIAIATVTVKAAPLALALPLPLTPTVFKLNSIAQAEKLDVVSTKANSAKAAANITQTTRSALTNSAFGTSDMLLLLQNSFNTNFPAGAGIAFGMDHLYVVDSTGTNIILDPGGVVSIEFGERFISGLETQINNQNNTVLPSSGNSTEMVTARVIFRYDDSGMATADRTVTKFDFSGLYVVKVSTNLKTLFSRVSLNFEGTGDGTIHNQQTILTGAITGNSVGTASF